MTQHLEGRCLCGAISYSVAGEPAGQLVCHCRDCQRQTGSACSTIMGVPAVALTINGEPSVFQHEGESGRSVKRFFCGDCGSPLFTEAEASPGVMWVKTGTLDNPDAFTPQVHIWCASKQSWLETGDVPAAERNP
ncbi:GFA family protein [Pontixanthobacter luteolus]|uniref:GFA family protein n=1 Tax=Pontixanthobacter luteolus TaxID=295089 RepID=UPI00230474B5|nr:GFA family protein [Pontixanthobacter luteolus]